MRDFTPLSNELELELNGSILLKSAGVELNAPRCKFLLRISDTQANLLWLLDPGVGPIQISGLPTQTGQKNQPLLLRAKVDVLQRHHEALLRSETPEDLLGIEGGIFLSPLSYDLLEPISWEQPLSHLLPLL